MFSKKNGLVIGEGETENTHNTMRFYDLVDTLAVEIETDDARVVIELTPAAIANVIKVFVQWIDEYAAREESTDDDDTDSGPGG